MLRGNREASAFCMQDFDVLNDTKGIRIPEVYTIETSTDTKQDKCAVAAQKLIHEQAKNS